MAELKTAGQVPLIAEGDPCGPDLFEAEDPDFTNYMAHAEGLLPGSFFDLYSGKPFDPVLADITSAIAGAAPFVARTLDMRMLALLAKFHVLNRSFSGFVTHLGMVAELLALQWEAVHPRGESGDFTLRLAALQALDDIASVVMPLQHLPLVKPPRGAAISMRAQMVAAGDVSLRDDEEQPEARAIETALKEVGIAQLVETRDLARQTLVALDTIRNVTVERVGHASAVKFVRLEPLAKKILAFLEENVERRDPAQALVQGEAETTAAEAPMSGPAPGTAPRVMPGELTSARHVGAALAAVEQYFCATEPSNPALLLVRQAIQLIGKSFVEAITILAPGFVDQAAINIGRSDMFALPLQRLAEFSAISPPADDSVEIAALTAGSRAEAVALMSQVTQFYGRTEPSSPIPFLIDRARALAGRDFLSILKDILPENTLRNIHSGN